MCIVLRAVSFGSLLGGNLAVSLVGPVVWLHACWKPCRVSGWASGFVQCLLETLPCSWSGQRFDSNLVETSAKQWIPVQGLRRWLWWNPFSLAMNPFALAINPLSLAINPILLAINPCMIARNLFIAMWLVFGMFCDVYGVIGVVLSWFRAHVIHFDRICEVYRRSCHGCDNA